MWSCEFCGSSGRPAYEVFIGDHRDTLIRCGVCRSFQVATPVPEEVLQAFYTDEYFLGQEEERDRADKLARNYLSKIKQYLGDYDARGVRALEIGAGYGFFGRHLHARTGIMLDVIEPSQHCRAFIEENIPQATIVGETWQGFSTDRPYELVFGFHLVEHLSRLGPFLETVAKITEPGSRAFFITPNADSDKFQTLGHYWGWACPNQHLQFISEDVPESYWEDHGFRLKAEVDMAPRAIAFPSRYEPRLRMLETKLSSRIRSSSGRNIPLRAIRKLTRSIRTSFEPNRKELSLLGMEQLWERFITRKPKDELLIVLERA